MRNLFITLVASIVLLMTVGCFHLSVDVREDLLPSVIKERMLANKEIHPKSTVTYEKIVDMYMGENDAYSGAPIYKPIKFGPRVVTDLEAEYEWRIKGLEDDVNQTRFGHVQKNSRIDGKYIAKTPVPVRKKIIKNELNQFYQTFETVPDNNEVIFYDDTSGVVHPN